MDSTGCMVLLILPEVTEELEGTNGTGLKFWASGGRIFVRNRRRRIRQ